VERAQRLLPGPRLGQPATGLQLNMVELPKAERLLPTVNPILAQWIIYFRHWHEESIMQQIQHPPIRGTAP